MADETPLLTCRDTIVRIVPPWLTRYWAGRYLYSLAIHQDTLVELAARGIDARFPTGLVPGQLPRLGRDRSMRRGFYETDATYAARLRTWLDVRRSATTHHGLLDQIASIVAPHAMRMRIVNDTGDWYTRNTDGSREFVHVAGSWNWDSLAPTTRFWVILYPPSGLWTREGTWGDPGFWGDGGTIGSTAAPEHVEAIRNVIYDCRAAHTYCQNVILAFDTAMFDPAQPTILDGHWNLWSHRSPNAAYWHGA